MEIQPTYVFLNQSQLCANLGGGVDVMSNTL